MKINYEQYRARARKLASNNCDENGEIYPSEADQSGAEDTDINVIVKRYGVYGTVPQGMNPPTYGMDMTGIPLDLRELIDTARSLESRRAELPEELRAVKVEELISMTPEQIAAILSPPTPASTEPQA